MATYSGLATVRDDFRCSLCRQKNAFHCEHDTPYRDQLLGTYDQVKPHMSASSSRRETHRTGSHVSNNTSLTSHNTTRKISTAHNADVRYQQGKIPENSTVSHTTIDPVSYNYARTYEHKQKKKSCVIL
jgi:hypothetical protein